ncbi:MAG: glutamine--fructose-6-phosphate transaminase (isomerizing) [Candidatus Altiarchaeota archaeon]|nr:glutamine--fructose-6-phosphate transaminase (isomerizing) [Candidatus Altiarchaeota archaeon]
MCGIVGYVGSKGAKTVVFEGLKTLEYRGYDSAGIAVNNSKITVVKDVGFVEKLEPHLSQLPASGNAIGHTRWATHGVPNQVNAHPHTDMKVNVVAVHNGIIENFMLLKQNLKDGGVEFKSDTDTEVIPQLLSIELNEAEPFTAFKKVIEKLEGSYAILVMIKGDHRIFFARNHSPLVIGKGEDGRGENLIASDVVAFLKHTKQAIFVKDGDVGYIDGKNIHIEVDNQKVGREITEIEWSAKDAMKDGYPHFMLKEIYEQPDAVKNTLLDARIDEFAHKLDDGLEIVAAGTSYHAGLAFQYASNMKCRLIISSEFSALYRGGSVLAISQSGETADTLQAVRAAEKRGEKIYSIVNVNGSTLTRISDQVVHTHAGPEIGVAATKTFTTQLAVLYAVDAALKGNPKPTFDLAPAIALDGDMKALAKELTKTSELFYIGRGPSAATAREGALKLKELAYLHAEAYEGGELKHGPLALIEDGVPIIAICPNDTHKKKMMGNIEEVKARGAKVFVFGEQGDKELEHLSDKFYGLPKIKEEYSPMTYVIPLQLLAYHTAVLLGKNPDKPRNLAKSVTVE